MTTALQPCSANPLCWTFQEQAKWVWDQLRWDHTRNFGLSEPHLTESVLSVIEREHPQEVVVRKFSSIVEGRHTGADWEWWFGSLGHWVGLRVQAKKIDSHVLTYPELPRINAKSKERQVDRLISSAKKDGLLPVYCFYNYWRKTSADPYWNCGTFPFDRELWGCSIAHAESVRAVVNAGREGLADLAGAMRPWMCLVCCRGFSDREELAHRVFGYLTSLPVSPIEGVREAGEGGRSPDSKPWKVVEELPDHARAVLHGRAAIEVREDLVGVMIVTDKIDLSNNPRGGEDD